MLSFLAITEAVKGLVEERYPENTVYMERVPVDFAAAVLPGGAGAGGDAGRLVRLPGGQGHGGGHRLCGGGRLL